MNRAPGAEGPDHRAVFRAVYGPLRRYCTRLAGDLDQGEDIAQEAFVRLMEAEVDGEPGALRAWLFTTATRLAQDRRKVERNRERLLRESAAGGPSGPAPPDQLLAEKRRRREVRRALDGLPDRDRQMLLLRAEGFSYREIGRAVDAEPSSVGALILRARKRLREALDRRSDDVALG